MLVRWVINDVPWKLEDYSSIFIIHTTELNVFLGGFGPTLIQDVILSRDTALSDIIAT